MKRLGWLVLLSASCGAPPGGPDGGDAGSVSDAGFGLDAGEHQASAALRACATKPAAVSTIAAVTARVNALPAHASVGCLVASLARPIELVATTSTFSAQPAGGATSPRVFIFVPGLILSVVGDGAGAKLLELGEYVTPTRTLKGELELPASAALASDAALTRVEQTNGTSSCGVCHRNEQPHPTLAHAYVSVAFRPNPGTEVKLPSLIAEHQRCVDTAEVSERCELSHALFDFGAVRQGAFPPQLELFF